MKKIKFVFLFCFLFVLCGCNKTEEKPQYEKINYYEQKIENDELVQLVLSDSLCFEEDSVDPLSLGGFYHSKTSNPLTTFKEGVISEKSEIICGYIPRKTFEKIEKNKLEYISYLKASDGVVFEGVDWQFHYYRAAVRGNKLAEDEQISLYRFENTIPAEFNDLKLLFVIEMFDITFKDNTTNKLFYSVPGKIEGDNFEFLEQIFTKHYKGEKFIVCDYDGKSLFESHYVWLYYFYLKSLQVKTYEEKEVVEGYFDSDPATEFLKNYNETFGSLIVSEKLETLPRDKYYFDYDGIKEILDIE